jgi:hypothetical protein
MIPKLLPSLLVAAGSAIFIAGAFLPVSRVYVLRTADEKLAIMQGRPTMWNVHLGMMGGGAAMAAVGVAALPIGAAAPVTVPALAAAATMVAGTVLWGRHLHLRVRSPEGFASGRNPHWHFVVYTLLMQIGLLAFALALFRAGAPTWMWVVPAAGTGLTLLAFAIFRDVPPLVHYIWLLAVAVGMAVTRPPPG